jgi:hypothetical protein
MRPGQRQKHNYGKGVMVGSQQTTKATPAPTKGSNLPLPYGAPARQMQVRRRGKLKHGSVMIQIRVSGQVPDPALSPRLRSRVIGLPAWNSVCDAIVPQPTPALPRVSSATATAAWRRFGVLSRNGESSPGGWRGTLRVWPPPACRQRRRPGCGPVPALPRPNAACRSPSDRRERRSSPSEGGPRWHC